VHGLDKHLRQHYKLPAAARRELLAAYAHLSLQSPDQVCAPQSDSAPLVELGEPIDAFACCYRKSDSSSSSSSTSASKSICCSYITTNRKRIRQHLNKEHETKLTDWPKQWSSSNSQLLPWRLVKVQSFFREKRYIRYFIVQEQQQQQQQPGQQQYRQETAEQD
jgi:hypothetical protein